MNSGQTLERDRRSKVVACVPVALLCGAALLLVTGSRAARAAANPYRIAYDNGVAVEVLAVSMAPSRGKPFWQPDGARLIDAPYESRDPGYGRNTGNTAYEIVARVTGAQDKPIYMTPRAANGISVGYGVMPYQGDKTLEDVRVFECSAPPGTDELEFELGIAANTWQTVRTFKTLGVYGEGPARVEVVDAQDWEKKSKPELLLRVKLAPSEDAMRLLAIDDAGVVHFSTGHSFIGREGHTLEAIYPDLPRERIKEFRVERCAYEWKPIESIHLKPPGDWRTIVREHLVARLLAQELKYKPETDAARIDDDIEKIARLKVFDDADVWVAAIRDLAEIGPPAIPAIVAELRHTARPYARSGLAIALRAIGDPRAVPGLIEALADCPFAPNDYGGGRTKDPALVHFMLGVQRAGAYRSPEGPTFDLGRPVNEITESLERLTDHSEGNQPARNNERRLYLDAAARWRNWWDQNKGTFLEDLPILRVSTRPEQLAPQLPDPQRLAADLKAEPKLADRRVLDQWTLLHLAIAQDSAEVVKVLVNGGADVNLAGVGGWTPLHLAVALEQPEIIQLLLDHKADVNAKTREGFTPLLVAAGVCPPPLYVAVPDPNLAIVKLLLDKGADAKVADARGRTALHGLAGTPAAAPIVELLLERGIDVNSKDARNRTPLHRAVECNREDVVELLLSAGADVNAKDTEGRTPLRMSSYSLYYTTFNSPIVAKLLEKGTDVDLPTTIALGGAQQLAAALKKLPPAAVNEPAKTDDGRTPLHWAIARKSPEMVKLLLDAGADPNGRQKDGNAPLHTAVFAGDKQVIDLLIAAKADVNAKGQGDCVPLYWACHRLSIETVNQLLAAGAKPGAGDPKSHSPLMMALQAARENDRYVPGTPKEKIERAKTIVTALLAHGADPNERVWGEGYTAIYGAGGELAELLFERGAKLDVITDAGETPLHYAAILSREELLRFLLKHNVALEVKNKKGETPLHCAVKMFEPKGDTLKLLLDAGANLAARDDQGKTPLHRAVEQGSPKSITALLDKGADIQAKDNEGATPMHLAAKIGREPTILLLLKHGASINAPDNAGRTPLQWVTNEKTKDLLLEHGATPGVAK